MQQKGVKSGVEMREQAIEVLTSHEQTVLQECEAVLERGLMTFVEVGNALLRIRDNRLYRATHRTFQQYCHDRWNIGRAYAWRLIGAAERIKLLPSDATLRPQNEFQVRPFLTLAPEEFPAAWQRVLAGARHGKITPRLLQTVAEELRTPQGKTQARRGTGKRRRTRNKTSLGHILVLLQEIRRRLERRNFEEAIAIVDDIENELFV